MRWDQLLASQRMKVGERTCAEAHVQLGVLRGVERLTRWDDEVHALLLWVEA